MFTDIKSVRNFNTIEKNDMWILKMSISPLSLCLGWRELPYFYFPVFGALPAPTEVRRACLVSFKESELY